MTRVPVTRHAVPWADKNTDGRCQSTIKRILSIYEILMNIIYAIINLITSNCLMMSRHALLSAELLETIHLGPLLADVVRVTGPASARHLWTLASDKCMMRWQTRDTLGHVTRGVNQSRDPASDWASWLSLVKARDQTPPVSHHSVSSQSQPTQWVSPRSLTRTSQLASAQIWTFRLKFIKAK